MTKSHSGLPFGTAPTDAAHSRIIFIACMRDIVGDVLQRRPAVNPMYGQNL
jgi:hypothetical protein